MKTLPPAMLVVGVAAVSSLATLVAQKQIQKSTVYIWSTTGTTANQLHNVTNVGQSPATFYVIGWTVPGAK